MNGAMKCRTEGLPIGRCGLQREVRGLRTMDFFSPRPRFCAIRERRQMANLVTQSRLLNDISHELRSPLARLNVALGLARQRSGVESADMLDRIELEAARLNELIGRILTLARLEDGEQLVPQTPVPLDEIVVSVC